MTKDSPVAAGVAIPEDVMQIARDVAADLDDIHFNSRSWKWIDDAREIIARAIVADRNRSASPVQAGIDPLVAETIAKLVDPSSHNFDSFDLHHEAAALLRSQAERIATLEEVAMAKDIEHRAQLCEMSERFRAVNIQRVIEASGDDILAMRERTEAAESRLAEAREALEEAAEYVAFNHFASDRHRAVELVHKFRATLSRLKPGEKGGE